MTSTKNLLNSLHTPESLLDNAEELLKLDTPASRRAAILEAVVALESYVQSTVFTYLTSKLGCTFSDWLEQKTKMDFDARLSILTPYALGISVETQSNLWNEYKVARKIRHEVVHQGKKVSYTEARSVIDITSKWIAHIGFTIELELKLTALKDFIEKSQLTIDDDQTAKELILNSFREAKVESFIGTNGISRAEYLRLYFGKNSILLRFRVKEGTGGYYGITQIVTGLMYSELANIGAVRGVYIDFLNSFRPSYLEEPIQKLFDDKVYYVSISCRKS